MEINEYIDKIREVMRASGTYNPQYFEGHLPRFIAQVEMFKAHLDGEDIRTVYDLGTNVPYTSFYFNVTKSADVRFGCYNLAPYAINENAFGFNINLINPGDMPKADLVICTECLEHLPCNIVKTRDYLAGLVNPGKYLLLSFPLNGHNAKDYDQDLPYNPEERNFDHHIREFTPETAREFYSGTGFELVEERITYTAAYGGNIMNVLMRKK